MTDNNDYDLPIDIPEDESSYKLLLDEANATDLSEIERSQCVNIRYKTNDCPIIIFLPKLALQILSTNDKKLDKIIMKKILLLFIKKVNEIITTDYIIIYGHTPLNILSQQTVIYKYYKILPRPYKKNIKKLIIIHPQLGIKMLFEFSKVFLSSKFYNKLILLDNISDLQRIISPSILLLPFKFIKYEDDDKDLKYIGNIPSLVDTYIQPLGTTKLLADCISFIRNNNGFDRVGIFRIPGDENILKLAKIRMQRMYSTNTLPVIHDKIVIGIEDTSFSNDSILTNINVYASNTSTIENNNDRTSQSPGSRSPRRGTTLATVFSPTLTSSPNRNSTGVSLSTNTPPNNEKLLKPASYPSINHINTNKNNISTVVFTDIDSIAQILKFSLRELPEPIITYDCYDSLLQCTKRWKSNDSSYSKDDWEIEVQGLIDSLPQEHKSTLDNLLYFLAEVASYSSVNNMDASNLATVFAPTLMRSRDADNAAKFLSEVGFSSIILLHLIQNFESVLATNNRMRSISNASFTPDILVDTIIQRNPLNRSNRNSVVTMQSLESIRDGINHITLLENDSIDGNDVSVNIPSNEPLNNAIDEIQSGLSSAMLERFGRGRRINR